DESVKLVIILHFTFRFRTPSANGPAAAVSRRGEAQLRRGDLIAIAVANQHGLQGHIHIHVEVTDPELADAVLRNEAFLQNTHDGKPMRADLDVLAKRILRWKKPRLNRLTDNADSRARLALNIGKHHPLLEDEIVYREVRRVNTDQFGGSPIALPYNVGLQDDFRTHIRQSGQRLRKTFNVTEGKSGREFLFLLLACHFLHLLL